MKKDPNMIKMSIKIYASWTLKKNQESSYGTQLNKRWYSENYDVRSIIQTPTEIIIRDSKGAFNSEGIFNIRVPPSILKMVGLLHVTIKIMQIYIHPIPHTQEFRPQWMSTETNTRILSTQGCKSSIYFDNRRDLRDPN